jgi:hypothetical protein
LEIVLNYAHWRCGTAECRVVHCPRMLLEPEY